MIEPEKVEIGRWRRPILNHTPQSLMLSVPLVIDVSSLTLRLFRSTLRRGGLPIQWRVAILLLDMAITAGVQYALLRDKPEKQPLPMGSNVEHSIGGRRVRKWGDDTSPGTE